MTLPRFTSKSKGNHSKIVRAGFVGVLMLGVCCLSPPKAYALGLGDIEIYSTMYQSLDAEIEVLNASSSDLSRLEVSLAPTDQYRNAGIDRMPVFNNFQFEVIEKTGRHFIHITSGRTVIKEPFLHFLIQADWVYGRLVREYTVILDLPLFGEESAQSRRSDLLVPERDHTLDDSFDTGLPVVVDEVRSETEPEEATLAELTESDRHSVNLSLREIESLGEGEPDELEPFGAEAVEEVDERSRRDAPDYYGPVRSGENLWNIVSNLKPEDVTMNQAMLAVLRSNADAFIDGNINLLKKGARLYIPGYNEMLTLSRTDALAEAKRQNALWEEYRASIGYHSYRLEEDLAPSTPDPTGIGSQSGSDALGADSEWDTSDDYADIDIVREALDELTESGQGDSVAGIDTRMDILPGEQDSQLSGEWNTDGRTSPTGSVEDSNGVATSQLRENIETESAAGAGLSERLDTLGEQQKVAKRLLDLQSAAGAQLQDQADQVLNEASRSESSEPSAGDSPRSTDVGDAESSPKPTEAAKTTPTVSRFSKQETPIDFLKLVFPRSWVNDTWFAIDDVAGNPSRIFDYPILLITLLGFLALIAFLVWWFKFRKDDDDHELTSEAIVHDLADELDEFGNPIEIKNSLEDPMRKSVNEANDSVVSYNSGSSLHDLDRISQIGPHSEEETMLTSQRSELDEAPPEPAPRQTPDSQVSAAAPPSTPASTSKSTQPTVKYSGFGDQNDPTVTEASTYITYALYDQAEELLRDSLKNHPENKNAYFSSLIDLYYASQNKDQLVSLANQIDIEFGPSDLWEKVVVLGKSLAPNETVFKEAHTESKFTLADFTNTDEPAGADLLFDSTQADEAGADIAVETDSDQNADLVLSDEEEMLSEFEEGFDKTMADLGLGQPDSDQPDSDQAEVSDAEKLAIEAGGGGRVDLTVTPPQIRPESDHEEDATQVVLDPDQLNIHEDGPLGESDLTELLDASRADLGVPSEPRLSEPERSDGSESDSEPENSPSVRQGADEQNPELKQEPDASSSEGNDPAVPDLENLPHSVDVDQKANLDVSRNRADELAESKEIGSEPEIGSELEIGSEVENLGDSERVEESEDEIVVDQAAGDPAREVSLTDRSRPESGDGVDEPNAQLGGESPRAPDTGAGRDRDADDPLPETGENVDELPPSEELFSEVEGLDEKAAESPLETDPPPASMVESAGDDDRVSSEAKVEMEELSIPSPSEDKVEEKEAREDAGTSEKKDLASSSEPTTAPEMVPQSPSDGEHERTSSISLDLGDILKDQDRIKETESDGMAAATPSTGEESRAEDDIPGLRERSAAIDELDHPAVDEEQRSSEEVSKLMDDILESNTEKDKDEVLEKEILESDPFTHTIESAQLMGGAADSKPEYLENKDEWELVTSTAVVDENEKLSHTPSDRKSLDEIDLGLAKQYIEMGDKESARSILDRVIQNGAENGRNDAIDMLREISER